MPISSAQLTLHSNDYHLLDLECIEAFTTALMVYDKLQLIPQLQISTHKIHNSKYHTDKP